MARIFDPEIGRATRWTKGQGSPNPGGRPKRTLLTPAYLDKLSQNVPGNRKRTFAELIAERVVTEAANGSIRAAAELADRTEGKSHRGLGPDQSDIASGSLQEELDGLSREELCERVIKVILEMEAAAEVAGFQDRLTAARAKRAKSQAEGCQNYTLIESAELPGS
jgi:hypothetical protein